MRHAKSSWKHPDLPDEERPLNKRGKKDAPLMGQWLKKQQQVPQYILVSSAKRARQTADAVADASGFDGKIEVQDQLYLAEPEDYLATARQALDEYTHIMIIGHNPGMESLLQILSGKEEEFPTAAIANLSLPIEHWSELTDQTAGEVVTVWRPRDLRNENVEEEDIKKKEKDKKKKKK